MKLQIKHIAPYLPYGLAVMEKVIYGKINSAKTAFVKGQININRLSEYIKFQNIKPILRPLSELVEERDCKDSGDCLLSELVNGLDNHCDAYDEWLEHYLDYEHPDKQILKQAPYELIENLLELHFDVFGLIEHELAIDINTLQQ